MRFGFAPIRGSNPRASALRLGHPCGGYGCPVFFPARTLRARHRDPCRRRSGPPRIRHRTDPRSAPGAITTDHASGMLPEPLSLIRLPDCASRLGFRSLKLLGTIPGAGMTYGPHPWITSGYGPGPDEAQLAAGTFGEPYVSEQLRAAEQAGATRPELEELAQRVNAEAAHRRSSDARNLAAPARTPSSSSRQRSHGPVAESWPWPPTIPPSPVICGPDGNPNSPEAIARQRAAADRFSETMATAHPRHQVEYQQDHSRQVSQAGSPRAPADQPYEPGPGYWILKTLALLVFMISVIPAALTLMAGKPIAGWIVACALSGGALALQACVKRWGR
jgi:hypothetical protein